MLEVRLLTHALLNKASPKGIHSFISHFSKAPRALASGHPGAKVTTMVLLLPPCPMCCFKAQDKTKACNSDSATCHHTAVLPEDVAQVLAARAVRLLLFVHINVLGNHTEELLNLMGQTITKQNYMSIFRMMGL